MGVAELVGVVRCRDGQPLNVWHEYRTQPLVYDPQSYRDRHRGRTKEQLLREDHRGFDVLLVEGSIPDLPRIGAGRRVGGRPQLVTGRTSEEYLRDLPDDEVGLTPEAYILHFLDGLERRGHVLDFQTATYLLGAYLPASRPVPYAFWYPGGGRRLLDGDHPGNRDDDGGARVAVRVS